MTDEEREMIEWLQGMVHHELYKTLEVLHGSTHFEGNERYCDWPDAEDADFDKVIEKIDKIKQMIIETKKEMAA